MKKLFNKHLIIFTLFFIFTFYQNCAPPPQSNQNNSIASTSGYMAPPGLPEINYFKETRPQLICGKNGWAFLQRNYITQHCSGCHYQGSFVVSFPFGDNNLDVAYASAQLISKSQWHSFTTNNRLCYPNCNILPEGDVYYGLMEWVDHPKCP